LALLKQLQPYEIKLYASTPEHLDDVSQHILYYARQVEVELDRSEWAVIDELDRFHATFLRETAPLMIRKHRELEDWEEITQGSLGADFLKWAVEAGLVLYVERRLKEDPTLMLDEIERPLLSYALIRHLAERDVLLLAQLIEPDMVRLLLSFGADPNQQYSVPKFSDTVWQEFVFECITLLVRQSADRIYHLYKATVILLEAGADPGLICSITYFANAMEPLVSLKEPWRSLSRTQCRTLEKAVVSHHKLN
jgi:hypothetical protein